MTKQELVKQIFEKKTFLCVGLDTDRKKLPACVGGDVLAFNRAIIDATAPYCVAYKLNLAFYEDLGTEGWELLEQTIGYLRQQHPEQFVIADAKRGDIGNTSEMYAKAVFEHLKADAITVAPYMGHDSVEPFLRFGGQWTIVLALTSNAGSNDFQQLPLANGKRLFEQVVETSRGWGSDENMMYVVGATRGQDIGAVRQLVPEHFLLVPGVGAQGGSLEDVCNYAMTPDCGLLVNSSRGIIYASAEADFAEKAAASARKLQGQMQAQLEKIHHKE